MKKEIDFYLKLICFQMLLFIQLIVLCRYSALYKANKIVNCICTYRSIDIFQVGCRHWIWATDLQLQLCTAPMTSLSVVSEMREQKMETLVGCEVMCNSYHVFSGIEVMLMWQLFRKMCFSCIFRHFAALNRTETQFSHNKSQFGR